VPIEATKFEHKEVLGVEQFDPKEAEIIRAKMQAIDLLQAQAKEGRAKYKIELFFTSARSMQKPTPGVLSFWESGSRMHGGGDTKLYICPGKYKGMSECSAFIPDSGNASAILFCPKCGTSWKGPDVIGEHIARLGIQDWANLLTMYYSRLNHDADIYVKHAKDDIRTKTMIEQAKNKGGEVLAKVRERRALVIYPLQRIIKDTSAGASLTDRFKALLSA